MSNEITAYFKGRTGVAESLYQYDYGQVMVFDGILLPSSFEVHFEKAGDNDSVTVIGSDNRVAIPNECLLLPGVVTVFIYLHDGENDGEVEYVVKFNVNKRARPVADGTEDEMDALASAVSQALSVVQNSKKVNTPLDSYNQVDNGTPGQLLRTKGNGSTEWVDVGLPTDEQTAQAVSDWLDEHPEATTTVEDESLTEPKFSDALKLKAIKDYVTPEMFGAKGDGITDDTTSFNDMFNYGLMNNIHNFVLSSGASYKLATFTFESLDGLDCAYIFKFNNVNNIEIKGNNSQIVLADTLGTDKQHGAFLFSNCKNVNIWGILFTSSEYDSATNLPICAGVYSVYDNANFNIDISSYRIRYGFRHGYYDNADISGNQGIAFSTIKVTADTVGYPIAIDHGSSLNLSSYSVNAKRALYLCASENVTAMVEYITNRSAGANVYLKDNANGKGCKNVNLKIKDKGTTSYSACFAIGAYTNADFVHNDTVYFENINVEILLEKDANVQPISLEYSGTPPVATVVRNVNASVIDNSEIASGISIVGTRNVASNCKLTGFVLKAISSKDVYAGNVNTDDIEFKMENSICGKIYFANSTKKGRYKFSNVQPTAYVITTSTTEHIEINDEVSVYELFSKCTDYVYIGKTYGASADRPSIPNIGYMFYDTTLNKPIFYKAYATWVDATGTAV